MNTMLVEQIVIANRLDELRRMTAWLHGSAKAMGVGKDTLFKLDLCANEAVANIVSHAYSDDHRHDIILELHQDAENTSLVIRDDGVPFNPLDMPEHEVPRGLAEAGIGGLGVHLIRKLATRCRYQRVNGLNVLSLEV